MKGNLWLRRVEENNGHAARTEGEPVLPENTLLPEPVPPVGGLFSEQRTLEDRWAAWIDIVDR